MVYDEITGGVARQIVHMSTTIEDLKTFHALEKIRYFELAMKTYSKMPIKAQQSFLSFLNRLFGQSQIVGRVPAIWYDKGLFYRVQERAHPINSLVEGALFSLWVQNMEREIINLPEGCVELSNF